MCQSTKRIENFILIICMYIYLQTFFNNYFNDILSFQAECESNTKKNSSFDYKQFIIIKKINGNKKRTFTSMPAPYVKLSVWTFAELISPL